MARVLKALWKVLGVIGTLLVAAAGVSVDQAGSNLASWVTWFGSTHVPAWLASSRADTAARTSGVAMLLIAGVGGFMGWRSRLHRERAAQRGAGKLAPTKLQTAALIIKGGGGNQVTRVVSVNMDAGVILDETTDNVVTDVKSIHDKPND